VDDKPILIKVMMPQQPDNNYKSAGLIKVHLPSDFVIETTEKLAWCNGKRWHAAKQSLISKGYKLRLDRGQAG
jgi:hypothetical protein